MEWNLLDKQQEFLQQLKNQGKSFNTVKNYKADLQCFNTFLIEKQNHLKINDFTTSQILEYSHFLDHKYGSPNSVRRRVQALRLFFDFLITHDLFQENPLKKMAVSPKVLDNPEPTPFHEVLSAYQLLKTRLQNSQGLQEVVASRNIVLFHLIYGAGLKVSDLAELTFESILKERSGYRVLVEHPKRDPYSIPLPPLFKEDFETYKKIFTHYQKAHDLEIDHLFFNGNPYKILAGGLSPRGTELFFEELKNEMKTKITAKSLRQACIFKWLTNGIAHTTIKEWMGVTPSYSLELYLEEISKNSDNTFLELESAFVS